MKFKHDNIDDFFKDAFSTHNIKDGEISWFDIDKKVSRNNFLRFSIVNFNVYYLITIVCTVLLTGYVGLENFRTKKILENNLQNQQRTVQVITDTVYQVKTKYEIIEQEIIQEPEKKEYYELQDVSKVDSVIQKKEFKEKKNVSASEERKNIYDFDTIKNIVIIKPGPVIVKDTVFEYKTRIRNKKR